LGLKALLLLYIKIIDTSRSSKKICGPLLKNLISSSSYFGSFGSEYETQKW
jgi:hypothetical protein